MAQAPFLLAAGGTPSLCAAYSAVRGDTAFSITAMTPVLQNSTMGSLLGQNSLTTPSALLIITKSVSDTILKVTAVNATTLEMNALTSVLSVGNHTLLSPGSAIPALLTVKELLPATHLPHLNYFDFSSYIISHPPFDPVIHLHDNIFSRVLHPYDPFAFQSMLDKHNLSSSYPLLVDNLLHGFPLGCMPPISQTVIILNNPSFLECKDSIFAYLTKEISTGHMSGPFSQDVVECILHGPFHASPLIATVQTQNPREPDKICICHHLLKGTRDHASVNSHIAREDFPTHFDTTSNIANIVSSKFLLLLSTLLHKFFVLSA